MKEKKFLIWDTETTGLPLHPDAPLDLQPHVIEFGGKYLSCKTGKVIGEIDFLIDPGIIITDEITKITGITNDAVKGKPRFIKLMPQIAKAFHESAGCLAHNSPFDEFMLTCEFRRCGMMTFEWPPVRLCSISLYRNDFGYDPKLTQLYERVLGRKLDQKHRAGSDVDALVEIVQKEEIWRMI